MAKRKVEKVEVELDDAAVKMLDQITKWTIHDRQTVLEVLLALWMFQEKNRGPRNQ